MTHCQHKRVDNINVSYLISNDSFSGSSMIQCTISWRLHQISYDDHLTISAYLSGYFTSKHDIDIPQNIIDLRNKPFNYGPIIR